MRVYIVRGGGGASKDVVIEGKVRRVVKVMLLLLGTSFWLLLQILVCRCYSLLVCVFDLSCFLFLVLGAGKEGRKSVVSLIS